jgi:hypothetical protein
MVIVIPIIVALGMSIIIIFVIRKLNHKEFIKQIKSESSESQDIDYNDTIHEEQEVEI